jgi:beta-1,4-mannosyltransferase
MRRESSCVPGHGPIIGCWPGRSFAWNSFPTQFCDAVEAAGCTVVDVDSPGSLKTHIDILHIHWPEQIFWGGTSTARATVRTAGTVRALRRLHAKGVRIVWMVHNLAPHELSPGKALLWRWLSQSVSKLADGFMTLSPATVPIVQASIRPLRGKPFAAAWHPAYPRLPDLPNRSDCRRLLAVAPDQRLFIMPGLLRRYKGAEELVTAFSATAPAEARLLIAGKCDDDALAATLRDMASRDDRITLEIKRFSDEAFARLLVAADAVILPYRNYLHAGSIIHALSYARPVITPASPFATGLADAVGVQWVRTFDGIIPAHAFDGTDLPTGELEVGLLDPDRMGERAASLYHTVLQIPATPRSVSPALEIA